jgi:hypothetical protein
MTNITRKRLVCRSGFTMSVQAGETKYCEPRNNTGPYASAEIGFPSEEDNLIIDYAEDKNNPTETVYGWVPAGIITALIIKHKGISSGDCPPLDITPWQSMLLAETLSLMENDD